MFPQLIGIIIGDIGQVVSKEKRTQTTTRQTSKFTKSKYFLNLTAVMEGARSKQGTNVAHNVRGGLLIDLTIVAIALLLRYTLSISLKLTYITQWNVGAVVLEQF